MATDFWRKIGEFGDIPSFVVLAFRNGLHYRNSDFKRLNSMNFVIFTALCRNLVRFGPVTPEFFAVKMTTFAAIWQKSAYHAKYLRKSWTDLHQTYKFDKHMGGNDYSDIRLAISQWMFLWQPVKSGGFCRRRYERLLLFALAFDKAFAHHEAAFKRLNDNKVSTSYINLVSLCPIISEFMLLKRAIFAATRPQFWRSTFIRHTGVRKELDYRNFDLRIVFGDHFYTSPRNLVIFGSATPEFKT